MHFQRSIACAVLFLTMASAIARAQEPANYDEVLTALDAATTERKSWKADVEMKMNMTGASVAYTGTTTTKGDMSRTEMALNLRGQESRMVTISDKDKIQWTEMAQGTQRTITRIDINKLIEALGPEVASKVSTGQGPGTPIDVNQSARELLSDFAGSFEMTYTGTAEFGDGKVYLIEGKRTAPHGELTGAAKQLEQSGMLVDSIKTAFGVADGFPRSVEWFGPEGQTVMVLKYKNLVLNEDFPDGDFVYVPPAGAQVADMTPMMEQRLRQAQPK